MADVISPKGSQQKATGRGLLSGSVNWPRTLQQKADQPLTQAHLKFQQRNARGAALHCLVLDCSASMLAGASLALAKGLILQWAKQIYRQRAQLCVIGFGGGQARVLQTPRKAAAINEHWIAPIRGGGGTPVVPGLNLAQRVLSQYRKKSPQQICGLWLLTDGRFPDLPPRPEYADICAVVDFEKAPLRLGRAQQLAQNWHANYVLASEFSSPK